jgi:hypothetical protein
MTEVTIVTSTCLLEGSIATIKGYTFEVIVETTVRHRARLAVRCLSKGQEKPINIQGIDLTPLECRSLARMLEAVAITAEQRG